MPRGGARDGAGRPKGKPLAEQRGNDDPRQPLDPYAQMIAEADEAYRRMIEDPSCIPVAKLME